MECESVQLWVKAIWRFFKKPKPELPYALMIPLLEIRLKECKSVQDRDNMHTHVYWSAILNSQLMKSVPINGGMDKAIVVYNHNGGLFSH
jgi:hypothetical protein